jgi:hypothetical protein
MIDDIVVGVFGLLLATGVVYTIYHFISKYW